MNKLFKDINYYGKKDKNVLKNFKINKKSNNLLFFLNVIYDDLSSFIDNLLNKFSDYDNILICINKKKLFMEKQILLDLIYISIDLLYINEFDNENYYYINFKNDTRNRKYINVNNLDYILEFFNRYNFLIENGYNSSLNEYEHFFEYLFLKYKKNVNQNKFLNFLQLGNKYYKLSIRKSIKIILEYINIVENYSKINRKKMDSITNRNTKYSNDKFLNLFVVKFNFYIYMDGDKYCKTQYHSSRDKINKDCRDENNCAFCRNLKKKGEKYKKIYFDIHTRKRNNQFIFKKDYFLKKHFKIGNKIYQFYFILNNFYLIDKIFKLININRLVGGSDKFKNNIFFDLIQNPDLNIIKDQLIFFNDKLYNYFSKNKLENDLYKNHKKYIKLIDKRKEELNELLESKKNKLRSGIYKNSSLLINGTIKFIFKNYDKPFTKNNKILYYKNKPLKLNSNIRIDEGNVLFYLTKNIFPNDKLNIIEIGFAHGISSLFIGEGIRKRYDKHWYENNPSNDSVPIIHKDGSRHIIIDPYQFDEEHKWKGIGYDNMKKAELPFDLRTNPDYLELPKLINQENLGNECHLFFIDGSHRFDYTLLNLFMADKLVKKNGYLVIDDGQMDIVRDAINYFITHYLHWKIINVVHFNMVIFKKIYDNNYKSSRILSDIYRNVFQKIKKK